MLRPHRETRRDPRGARRCGLEIRLAKLDSRAGEVIDTFHVGTGPSTDDLELSRLEQGIADSVTHPRPDQLVSLIDGEVTRLTRSKNHQRALRGEPLASGGLVHPMTIGVGVGVGATIDLVVDPQGLGYQLISAQGDRHRLGPGDGASWIGTLAEELGPDHHPTETVATGMEVADDGGHTCVDIGDLTPPAHLR